MSSGGFFRINSEKWLVARGPWRRRKATKLEESHFRVPDFFLEGLDEAWIPEKLEILSTNQMKDSLLVGSAKATPEPLLWGSGDKESFLKTHAEILRSIRDGLFQKMVPFTEFFTEGQLSPWALAANMTAVPANLYPYGFWNSNEAQALEVGMAGATPELLYQREGRVLKTMALAGTAPIGNEEKLDTVKERDEHQIVIDGMRDVLSAFGSVKIGETKIVKYTALCHLKTEIEVELRDGVTDMELVRALHPTAALGGWPREASRQWHSANEMSRGRGGFGAPMIVQYGDQVWVLVRIRGVQWSGSKICLRVGCGVVEGSVSESEWDELALKKRATLRGLGLD